MTQEIVRLGAAWHFRLERKLARSTFGEIWCAEWLQTGQAVAVKRLDRSVTLAPALNRLRVETLRREVEVYQSLGENLHFARHLHTGEVDSQPVVVLELLDGDLAGWLDRWCLPLRPVEALEWVRQLAVALEWMHRHGQCHLDIKPGNLLFREVVEGVPPVMKLADFGLALDCRAGAAEHCIPGSLGWMAPEQVFPHHFDAEQMPVYRSDPRADVYALGLLLYYLLTGEKTAFAHATETRLGDDPEALHWITPADFSQYTFGEEERGILRRAAAVGATSQVVHCTDTWIPGVRGRPEKKPNFGTDTPAQVRDWDVDVEAIGSLLELLLAPCPAERPPCAGEVLHLLESLMPA